MAGETTVYVSTERWQQAAQRRLRDLGRGALAQMARELAVRNGMRSEDAARKLSSIFSRIVNGQHKTSEWIGPMSDWLQIERPTERLRDARLQRLVELASQLDDDDLILAEAFMARLRRSLREGSAREAASPAEPVTEKVSRRSGRRGRDGEGGAS